MEYGVFIKVALEKAAEVARDNFTYCAAASQLHGPLQEIISSFSSSF